MEQIIRRRHPNSLPAMIMTAAIAADDKSSLERTPTMIVLENQLKKNYLFRLFYLKIFKC
jgi:hypothetical protein